MAFRYASSFWFSRRTATAAGSPMLQGSSCEYRRGVRDYRHLHAGAGQSTGSIMRRQLHGVLISSDAFSQDTLVEHRFQPIEHADVIHSSSASLSRGTSFARGSFSPIATALTEPLG